MAVKNWSLPTRYLHVGMVITISIQLFISLIMAAPDQKGGVVGKFAFEIHEIVGLAALAIILTHWAWSIFGHADGGLKHLFPWFGKARLGVVSDIKALLKGELPGAGNRGGLPGLIHGLGLLAVSAIAITGGILFILFPQSGEPGYIVELFAETHGVMAVFVWAYWLGHGGLAILHHFQGNDLVKKMFDFTDKAEPAIKANEKLFYAKINSAK